MEGAEVLTKFTADNTELNNATEMSQDLIEKFAKVGEVAIIGLASAVDALTVSLLKQGVEYNAEIETYMTRLTTLTGSAENANSVLEQIKKDALATPFDVKSLTEAESLLLATGLSAEETRKDIIALGNAVSASGGGNKELKRMAVNLQQIKNVGKASSLDIKQFAYAGIDIYGLLADSMGITKEEASSLTVTYDMLSQALQLASEEGGRYYGAMEAQSQTYNGAMSNLTESIEVFKGALAEELFNAVSKLIPKLTDMFNWLTANKGVIVAIGAPLLVFLNTLLGFFALQKITALFIALWMAISAHPLVIIIGLIGALVASLIYLWNNCEGFRNFVTAMWEGIKGVIVAVIGVVVTNFTKLVDGVKGAIEFLGKLKDKIVSAFTGAKDKVASIGSNMIKGLWSGMSKMKDWVIDKVKNMGKSILEGIKKVLGIKSPSTEFAIVGKYSAEGYVEGLEDMQKEIDATMQDTFNPFTNSTIGSMTTGAPTSNITIKNSMEFDALGQLVNNVKTFSGGAKNDYNYVGGY